MMRGLLVLIFLLPVDCQEFVTGRHNYVGCFLDNTRARDLPYRAGGLSQVTVRSCLERCEAQYYQYAGLQAGSQCWCGATYGRHGPGQCQLCPPPPAGGDGGDGDGGEGEGETETCGGDNSSSVYRTEVTVPGPPDSLSLTAVTDSSLELTWLAPLSPNGEVTKYRILVRLGQSHHRARLTAADKVLEFSSAVTSGVRVSDLLAGSQYNVSVRAGNDRGHFGPAASSLVWTSVGRPDVPAPPSVLRWDRERGTIRLKVNTVEDNGGEVKNYQVLVGEGSLHSVGGGELYGYKKAEGEGLSHWISAQLSPQYLAARGGEVTLGDGQLYGGYLNYGPLNSQAGYQLAVRVAQSLGGETKYSVSEPVSSDTNNQDRIVLRVSDDRQDYDQYRYQTDGQSPASSSSSLTTGLLVAVVVGALLLLAALAVFILVRRRAGRHFRRGRRADTQELTQTGSQVWRAAQLSPVITTFICRILSRLYRQP